jgi:hypothetical protein
VADVPVFQVRPPLRCCRQVPDSPYGVCGELASWERSPAAGSLSSFYCDEHRAMTDRPIGGSVVFRRVSLQVEVSFAATSPTPNAAQLEAFARLEAAARAVGAIVGVHAASTLVGRYDGPAVRQVGAGRPRRV